MSGESRGYFVIRILDTACGKLQTQFERQFKDWSETSGYVPTIADFKKCSKCTQFKRTVDGQIKTIYKNNNGQLIRGYFMNRNVDFSKNKLSKDGYHSVCKICRSTKK